MFLFAHHSGVDNRKIFEIERWATTRRCPPYLAIPTLSMRLFKGNNAKLIAGERELHLAWYGGEPFYQVQVFSKGTEKVLWDEKNIAKAEITLKKQRITAGSYQAR